MSESSPVHATRSHCNILLIEDDQDDIFLFEYGLRQSGLPCSLQTVTSIADGMAYLKGHDDFKDRDRFPLPDLIITDLGFRGHSGLHFLNWLHYQSEFRHVPVLCISGSDDPDKLQQARNFGARCVRKSAMVEDVMRAVREHLPEPAKSR